MSQRREKRLRRLERDTLALNERLAAVEQSTRAAHSRIDTQVMDAWWERSPYTSMDDAPAMHTTQRKSLRQRLADIFRKDR